MKLIHLRKQLGFRSWAEVVFALLSVYMTANFLMGFLGLSLFYVGILSVVGHAFAWYQIHLLGSLSERLEQFDMENKKLRETTEKLKGSLDTFQEQNGKLKAVSDRLAEENEQFHSQVDSLSQTVTSLEGVRDMIEQYSKENHAQFADVVNNLNDTLQQQKDAVKKQHELLDQTKEATNTQERVLLMQLHAQCQFLDHEAGMSSNEYQMFLNMIPARYRKTAAGKKFDDVDKNHDGIIDADEFSSLIEELVRAEASQ